MPFINRDSENKIVCLFSCKQYEGQEFLADDIEEVVAFNTPSYRELRAKIYPPMADYLDGIVKGDTAQVQKYIADCLAVKAKYPKA